jgi:hypothetical protein
VLTGFDVRHYWPALSGVDRLWLHWPVDRRTSYKMKIVYKLKLLPNGDIEKYEARMI